MKSRYKRLGATFPEEVSKISETSHHAGKSNFADTEWEEAFLSNYQPEPIFTISPWRILIIGVFFLFSFFGLFLKLFNLQIIHGDKNRLLANTNRIQMRVIHTPRGIIFDRNGKILAENFPGFRLNGRFISRDEALNLEAKNDPNFDKLELDAVRYYPFGELTSHILGYVAEISSDEIKDEKYFSYGIGDPIGRDGIEKTYEQFLKGKDGAEIIEVDAQGKKLRTLRKINPLPGQNIYLSVDVDLQKIAFDSLSQKLKKLGQCCGAAVAEDPQTGEILLLVSIPAYDNNAFTNPLRSSEVSSFFQDPHSPLLNRVIGGVYPPGSTFKITSSLAGLYSGKINDQTQFEDTGIIRIGPYEFANWYFLSSGKTDGFLNLTKALQRSNDIYFYRLGEKIGEKVIGEVASKLFFGKKLGIDLPGEVEGLVPSDEWKRNIYNEVWFPGDTLHLSIGQGFLLTTPLQILSQTAFMAFDGNLVQPRLVTKITDSSGTNVKQLNTVTLAKNIFKKEDITSVKKGLGLVTKEGGTAWPFFAFPIATAGKTGTAEFGDSKGKTHAWYTSYAPEDDPKIVLTVLIEAGGEGSNESAPIARDIYSWYFNINKKLSI